MQKFINAKIYSKNFKYENGSFSIDDDGKFCDVLSDKNSENEIIDLKNAKVLPILIDIHTHGAMNFDFSDLGVDNISGLDNAINYYHKNGIIPFSTTLTLPYEQIENIVKYHDKLFSMYLEGPFISKEKKGAQNELYIREPDFDFFNKIYDKSDGKIKVVTIAPEKNNAIDFIKKASKLCTVSIAHTNCDYDIACKAFDVGATGVTHLFNAMNGIHHRNPGPVMAALNYKNVMVELISDGYHIDKHMVKFVFDSFGSDRVVLISDSLECLGMPDGDYEIAGLKCVLKENVARLLDGTIAGSSTNLYECMKKAISFGIKEEDAIKASTFNSAKHTGILDKYGTIENKKMACFVVADDNLSIQKVYINGKLVDV